MTIRGFETNTTYSVDCVAAVMRATYDAGAPAHKDLDPTKPFGVTIVFKHPLSAHQWTAAAEWTADEGECEAFQLRFEALKALTSEGQRQLHSSSMVEEPTVGAAG